jgi:hypothetical protein
MDTDSLSAESAFPPPPPLLPPPVPPPVVNSAGPAEEKSCLWRWNERLALVVGGLTLLLLGVISGRVLRPDAPSGNGEVESVAAVASHTSESQISANATDGPAVEIVSEVEVNPPELVFGPSAVPPAATLAETNEPASVPLAEHAPQQELQPQLAGSTSEEAKEPDEAVPLPATPVTSPVSLESSVSLEGKVPTIKVPATTQVCGLEKKSSDRKLNTALTWAKSVSEANERAEEEEKLVFLIHVSGNFEMPGFT